MMCYYFSSKLNSDTSCLNNLNCTKKNVTSILLFYYLYYTIISIEINPYLCAILSLIAPTTFSLYSACLQGAFIIWSIISLAGTHLTASTSSSWRTHASTSKSFFKKPNIYKALFPLSTLHVFKGNKAL